MTADLGRIHIMMMNLAINLKVFFLIIKQLHNFETIIINLGLVLK